MEPVPNETQAPMLMGTAYSLFIIAWIVVIIRIWTRLHPKFALTWADYMIAAAMVSLGFLLPLPAMP